MIHKLLRIVSMAALLDAQSALAEEWRYCLAPSYSQHKVYITEPFPARASIGYFGSAFDRALNAAGITHDSVQCPRTDDLESALAARQDAADYNRHEHNDVVDFKWRP